MKTWFPVAIVLTAYGILVSGCASYGTEGTLGSLRTVEFEIKETVIDGSLDKALESYQRYLEETPETDMTPEAIRRLADLKIEKEYSATAELASSANVVDASETDAPASAVSALTKPRLGSADPIKTPLSTQTTPMTAPATQLVDSTDAAAAILASGDHDKSSESGAIADISE